MNYGAHWFAPLLAAVAAWSPALSPPAAQTGSPLVLTASVDDTINSVTSRYITSAVDRAQAEHATLLVVTMNTPGGISTSMDEIVTTLLNSRVPVVAFVSPPGARADSAGLFVAQAADLVAMAPGTNIGSAHPIAGNGADIRGDLGRKVVNDAVARVRNLATLHGRNADWAEKAVRESANINAEEAVRMHVADLEVKDLHALVGALDGRTIARPHAGPTTLRLAGARLESIAVSWSQQVLHLLIDPNVGFLLLLLAVIGLIAEMTTPGAILPGTVGMISAVLALVSLSSLPVNVGGLLLILVSFLLFLADVKAPTHGVLTAGGLLALVLGSTMLIDTGAVGAGVNPWLSAGAAIVVVAFFTLLVRKAISARKRPVEAGADTLAGRIGEVRERLDPVGTIFVAGALWKAVSIEGDIPPGTAVVVLERQGLQLSVAAADPGSKEIAE